MPVDGWIVKCNASTPLSQALSGNPVFFTFGGVDLSDITETATFELMSDGVSPSYLINVRIHGKPPIDFTHQANLAVKEFVCGPNGSKPGDIKYSGKCFFTGFNINKNTDCDCTECISCAIEFQTTGSITRGIF